MRKVSCIIPFKDWGLTRLELAVGTALESLGAAEGEVIVSDYGSTFTDGQLQNFREKLESQGARYVRTETDGVWSRSRALNAGAAVAAGDIFVASDADMLIPPRCLELVSKEISDDPNIAIFLSCLDLPKRWDDVAVHREGINWETLRREARRRPRWGMGLNAVTRELHERLRGWDERFMIYGGEDNDFAARVRRAGARIIWPERDEFGLLHMWHPSSSASALQTRATALQVERNKSIFRTDRTFVRNTDGWMHPSTDAPPIVSVVVSTCNRREMLAETIDSVLIQTMQDFEIIIVDDGSTDDTEKYVRGLADPRIRYVKQKNAGISAARNRGTREARGQFIAVLDDDDLMLPWRLESQLGVQENGPCIAYGTFVNFWDDTGELVHMGVKPMNLTTASLKGGAPGHSTWLVPTEWMRQVPYDEALTSGVDNDLALRMLRSGMRWEFCGDIVVLRRMHPGQVTVSDNSNQLGSASAALNKVQFAVSRRTLLEAQAAAKATPGQRPKSLPAMETAVSPYLPDHLVDRWQLMLVEPAEALTDELVVHVRQKKLMVGVKRLSWSDLVVFGKEASGRAFLVESKGDALGGPQIGDLRDLLRSEVDRLVEVVLEVDGQVAVINAGAPAQFAQMRVELRDDECVAVGVGSLESRRAADWMMEWFESPAVEAATRSEDVERLRDLWHRAVTPRRSRWKR